MQEMDGEFMSTVATTLSNLTVKKTKKEEVKMSNVMKPGGLTGIGIGLTGIGIGLTGIGIGLTGIGIGLTWNLRKNFDLIVKHLILFLTG